jgi:hypothetical protein
MSAHDSERVSCMSITMATGQGATELTLRVAPSWPSFSDTDVAPRTRWLYIDQSLWRRKAPDTDGVKDEDIRP